MRIFTIPSTMVWKNMVEFICVIRKIVELLRRKANPAFGGLR